MTAVATPAATQPPEPIVVYRDDGPLALALGRTLGRALPVPAPALGLAAAVPLLACALLIGRDASEGLAAALVAWAVLCGSAAAGRPQTGRLIWAVPPLLRATEYGGLIWLGAVAGGSAPAGAFALLAAVAFRQYDLVYRLRHRATVPPAWVGAIGGGWEGRLAVAAVALVLGVLEPVLFVAAALLGAVFVAESVSGWLRHQGELRPTMDDDDEEDGD
jgi:hypothetical protein